VGAWPGANIILVRKLEHSLIVHAPPFQLWEQQTTGPYLDEVRFIGNVLTPWSSWIIVAKPDLLESQAESVRRFLTSLTSHVRDFDAAEARATKSKDFIVKHFGYPEEEVVEWLKTLEYPTTKKGHSLDVVEQQTIEQTLE
jgi:ABC-type taurine transport system substrate-binding protein